MQYDNLEQLKTADLCIDLLSLCNQIPDYTASYTKSVIRIPDFWEFFRAVSSGEKISTDLVDSVVECIEKLNEAKINASMFSFEEKNEAKFRNHIESESVKSLIKNGLDAEGRLID